MKYFLFFNLLFSMLLFPHLSFSTPTSLSACQTSADSCDFYSCAENIFKCGEEGYFNKIAIPNCDPKDYSQKNKNSTEETFIKKVRLCLQVSAKELLETGSTCSSIKDEELAAHIPCFIESGYCEMSNSEILSIYDNPLDFLEFTGIGTFFGMWYDLYKICNLKGN